MNKKYLFLASYFLIAFSLDVVASDQVVSQAGAVFTRDYSNEKLGRAYKDPAGLTWGEVPQKKDSAFARLETQADAEKECRSIGARLPTRVEYEQLAKFLGKGSYFTYRENKRNGKDLVLPRGLTPVLWTSDRVDPKNPFFPNDYYAFHSWVGGFTIREAYKEVGFRCVYGISDKALVANFKVDYPQPYKWLETVDVAHVVKDFGNGFHKREIYMKRGEAIAYCSQKGMHLPKAKELALMAEALDLATIKPIETFKERHEGHYSRIEVENLDGSVDRFYHCGSKLDSKESAEYLMSSSVNLYKKDQPAMMDMVMHEFGYPSGLDGSGMVLCFPGR